MISVGGVSYRYPESSRLALDHVEASLEPSELVLVAGQTGSGKSTLMRSMNGLVPHFFGGQFSGSVLVDGRSTLDVKPRDLADRVGFVGQDPEDHAVASTVEDDIAFTLENLGLERGVMRKRVEEALDALGLARLRDRDLDTLSGGERQRAAIASALAAMPRYLVLDEPTSQLDPQSAEEVLSAVLRLRDEIGIGVALAEHRLERVLQYAEQVWLVADGSVAAAEPRAAAAERAIAPPVARLGAAMGWDPLPISLREARGQLQRNTTRTAAAATSHPSAGGDVVASLTGVSVKYGRVTALQTVSISVSEGECVAVIGRNGSGKTTLLRALAGLAGTRRVVRPERTGFVPQNPQLLLFRQTLSEEIAATRRGRGLDSSRDSVAGDAEKLGVSDLLERYPRDLSGGQKTRAALAAACSGNPKLILLDEPTRGLDEPGKAHLSKLIAGWRAEGRAVVVATHDVELAARLATRVVLMSEGEIVVDGSPHAVLGSSLTFSTQMNKVFEDPRILTVDDALLALQPR